MSKKDRRRGQKRAHQKPAAPARPGPGAAAFKAATTRIIAGQDIWRAARRCGDVALEIKAADELHAALDAYDRDFGHLPAELLRPTRMEVAMPDLIKDELFKGAPSDDPVLRALARVRVVPFTPEEDRMLDVEDEDEDEDVLAMATPWPLHEVLRKLADAADHLLNEHSCDTDGHEEIGLARDVARRMVAAFEPNGISHKEASAPLLPPLTDEQIRWAKQMAEGEDLFPGYGGIVATRMRLRAEAEAEAAARQAQPPTREAIPTPESRSVYELPDPTRWSGRNPLDVHVSEAGNVEVRGAKTGEIIPAGTEAMFYLRTPSDGQRFWERVDLWAFDVRDFGATCDGKTDDTTAFERAVAEATHAADREMTPQMVHVPSGASGPAFLPRIDFSILPEPKAFAMKHGHPVDRSLRVRPRPECIVFGVEDPQGRRIARPSFFWAERKSEGSEVYVWRETATVRGLW